MKIKAGGAHVSLDSILLGSQALLIRKQMFHHQMTICRFTASHLAVSSPEHRDVVSSPRGPAKRLDTVVPSNCVMNEQLT